MKDILILKEVSKSFRDDRRKHFAVLENINLSIKNGEFFIFLGPSGCGKSTLLRMMSGLEKEFSGTIALAEGMTRSDMSFVFQQFALLPWLSVFENVEVPLLSRIFSHEERRKSVLSMLRQIGLEQYADRFPRELSGGMRQRVGIARALVTNPKIVFMDEPFSELDSFIAAGLRAELLSLWHERRITVVMVTHIISEAVELGSRIAVMTPRPGRIEKIVENTLPYPRPQRSREFFALEDELFSVLKP